MLQFINNKLRFYIMSDYVIGGILIVANLILLISLIIIVSKLNDTRLLSQNNEQNDCDDS